MAAPIGNKNGRGRKGRSGRKGAGLELMKAQLEVDLMYKPQDIEVIKEKLRNKEKLSIREIMLLKEATGNERLISQHYSKVVPDQIKHFGDPNNPVIVKGIIILPPKQNADSLATPAETNNSLTKQR